MAQSTNNQSTNNSLTYVVITPARDEAAYIEKTIQSVIAQTIQPTEWVIVNDGSTDGTAEIIDDYAGRFPWIKAMHRSNRGFRQAGGGVIDAFYEGYAALKSADYEFLVKLDGDLSFDADYFERCLEKFKANPKLGIGGGDIYHLIDARLQLERNPRFHVRGATKIYRRECWQAIGGLIAAPGWDAVDEAKANMLGWETHSFDDLKIVHHRYTGSAAGSWRDAVKNGVADYVAGYHPLFEFAKSIRRIVLKPYVIGSIGQLYGFTKGYITRTPQVGDVAVIEFVREQQLRKLTFRSSIWK